MIESKIIDIVPDVEYEGTVYEQRMVVELPDCVRIGLFDYDLHAKREMIGDKKALSILGYIPNDASVEIDLEIGIEASTSKPLDWKNHTFRGYIERVNEGEAVVLDVGYGTVQIDNDVAELVDGQLKEDQFLQVRTNRSDLVGLECFNTFLILRVKVDIKGERQFG
jgi:hypothetical protein